MPAIFIKNNNDIYHPNGISFPKKSIAKNLYMIIKETRFYAIALHGEAVGASKINFVGINF